MVLMDTPVIVISGPTGSGKTDIASHLCAALNGEIISSDSRQVYNYLDAGTNKAGVYDSARRVRVTTEGIPQHLTDVIDPDKSFSAGEFVAEAGRIIGELKSLGKTPVVTGGTGLYIKALVHGLARLPEADAGIRRELKNELEAGGVERLYRSLKAVDPLSAEKNRSNPQRLVRALEVYRLTGKPISAWHESTQKPVGRFLEFVIDREREELYSNINERSRLMLGNGMVEETRKVLSLGFAADCPGLGSLGYRHVISHLQGALTLEETAGLIALDTRHYAKRQMTWFRNAGGASRIGVKKNSFSAAEIAKRINNMI